MKVCPFDQNICPLSNTVTLGLQHEFWRDINIYSTDIIKPTKKIKDTLNKYMLNTSLLCIGLICIENILLYMHKNKLYH